MVGGGRGGGGLAYSLEISSTYHEAEERESKVPYVTVN